MNDTKGSSSGLENNREKFKLFKILYFVYVGSFGILMPVLPLFFDVNNHFSKYQIGLLCMIPNFSCVFISPIMAHFADRHKSSQNEMFNLSNIISAAGMFAFLAVKSFYAAFAIQLITSAARAPMIPMLDARTIDLLQDKSRYGEIRLYGAASFGLLVLLSGFLLGGGGDNDDGVSVDVNGFKLSFYLHVFLCIATGFLVLMNPVFTNDRENDSNLVTIAGDTEEIAGMATSAHNLLPVATNDMQKSSSATNSSSQPKLGVLQVIVTIVQKNPEVLSFAIVVLLSGIGDGIIDAFLFLRIKELGGYGLIMGIGRFLTCVAEVPFFRVAGAMHKSLGTWKLLAITQFAFVVRFTYYSYLVHPWWILGSELLNGFTFALTWNVACTYANEIAPEGTEATVQSILDSLHFGLGCGLGALFGGILYDSYGSVRLFEISAMLSLLSFFLAVYQAIKETRTQGTLNNNHVLITVASSIANSDM